MKEYIEREAALSDEMCEGISCQECPFLIHSVNGGCKVVKYINGIPAADVVEVRHGRWIDSEEDGHLSICGVCNYPVDRFYKTKYCPNCGAKMDGGDNL